MQHQNQTWLEAVSHSTWHLKCTHYLPHYVDSEWITCWDLGRPHTKLFENKSLRLRCSSIVRESNPGRMVCSNGDNSLNYLTGLMAQLIFTIWATSNQDHEPAFRGHALAFEVFVRAADVLISLHQGFTVLQLLKRNSGYLERISRTNWRLKPSGIRNLFWRYFIQHFRAAVPRFRQSPNVRLHILKELTPFTTTLLRL